MKRPMILPTLSAIGIVGLSLLATNRISLAANSGAPPESRPAGRHIQQDISKWDLNHNGRLDPDEMQAYRRDKLKEQREQLEARAKAAADARRAAEVARYNRFASPALLKKYDANTNGILEPEE